VKRDGKDLSEDDVKKYVKSNLAGYKVPRDVEFVDELPRTSTGKVLKRELQEGSGNGSGDG
jgi:acyl-CoA synthetase (AMP-forming)/AMP-acid ligase II